MRRALALVLLAGAIGAVVYLLSPDDEAPAPLAPEALTAVQAPAALDGPMCLGGRVLGDDEKLIAGVPVHVLRREPREFRKEEDWTRDTLRNFLAERRPPHELLLATKSEPDGSFEVAGLHPDRAYEIRAVPPTPALGSARWVGPRRPARSELELHVLAGRRVAGQVVDARGHGVEAYVTASLSAERNYAIWDDLRWWTDGEAATDQDGRFELLAPTRRLCLWGRVRGHRWVGTVIPANGASTGLRLRLGDSAGALMEGRVTDEEGAPIADAHVLLAFEGARREDTRWSAMTTTSAAGDFALRHLHPGTLQSFSVSRPGFAPTDFSLEEQVLEAGQEVRQDVALLRGGIVSGTVADGAGRPVPDVAVSIRTAHESRHNRLQGATRTDAEGRYRIPAVALGPVRVRFEAEGRYVVRQLPHAEHADRRRGVRRGIQAFVWESGRTFPVDVVMQRGVPLEGRVLDPQGEPVPGAAVNACLDGPTWRGPFSDSAQTQLTDETGTYRFPGLEPAPDWTLHARAGTRVSRVRREIHLDAERDEPLFRDLVVGRPASIAGQVVDAAGRKVAGLPLRIERLGSRCKTDADGAFALRGLPPGRYPIEVGPSRSAVPTVEVERTVRRGEAVTGMRIEFPHTLSIAGALTDEWGRPLADASLSVQAVEDYPGYNETHAHTDEQGRFEVKWLAPGAYRFETDDVMLGEPVEAGRADVRLVRQSVTMRLIRGRVLSPDGSPVAFASICVSAGGGGDRTYGYAKARNGRFEVELAHRLGEVEFEVTEARGPGGLSLAVQPFERCLPAFPDEPVELRLVESLVVSGVVLDPEGRPVGGARLQVEAAEGGARRRYEIRNLGATTDAEGRFHIVGFAEGEATLSVDAGPRWTTREVLRVQPGVPSTIRLVAGAELRGRVLTPSGEGVERAYVFVQPSGAVRGIDWLPPNAPHAITAADGSFRIPRLTPVITELLVRAPYTQEAWSWPYLDTHRKVLPGAEEVVLRLEEAVRIWVEVCTPEGKPAPESSVSGRQVRGSGSSPTHRWERPRFRAAGEGSHQFVSTRVRPGRYELRASSDMEYGDSDRVVVEAPGPQVRLSLTKALLLRGRLVGKEVDDFEIRLWADAAGASDITWSDATGAFVLKLEQDGEGFLYAHRDGDNRCALIEGARPSQSPLDVKLTEGLRVAGRLIGLSRTGTGSAFAQVEDERGIHRSERIEADGTFSISGLPKGTYRLELWGDRLRGVQIEMPQVVQAGQVDLELRVRNR